MPSLLFRAVFTWKTVPSSNVQRQIEFGFQNAQAMQSSSEMHTAKMKLRKGSRPTKLTPSLLGIPLHQNTSASLSRPKALAGCRYTSKRSKLVWGFILQKDMESVQMVVSRSYENKGLYFIQKPLFVWKRQEKMILFRLERFPVRRTTNSGKKWPSMSVMIRTWPMLSLTQKLDEIKHYWCSRTTN